MITKPVEMANVMHSVSTPASALAADQTIAIAITPMTRIAKTNLTKDAAHRRVCSSSTAAGNPMNDS